jgi:competence protein ComEA
VSFDDRSDPPPAPEPIRPGPGRGAGTALMARARPWLQWFGAGRLVTGALLLILVVAGGWWLLRTPPPPTEAGLPYAATSTSPASPASAAPALSTATEASPPAPLVVHVAGAVARPGVYELDGGARVHDAIAAAGGPVRRADPDALNLAAVVTDGERIYVPRAGESVPVAAADPSAGSDAAPPGPIDLNHATIEELDVLPGVGPATAAAIIDHREQNGPFATVDDLEDVRGIGPAKLEAIRDLVTV